MNREDNPFYNLIGMMQEEGKAFNAVPFFIGKVTATAPFTVQIGELSITKRNMKINSMLLGGYSRSISIGQTSATGKTGSAGKSGNDVSAFSNHEHSIQSVGIPNGRMTMTDGLQIGNEVLLLRSEDGQQYILVCKLE